MTAAAPASPVCRFRCALVVGKFCPLHLGHVALIDQAAAASDEVVIVSYTLPEYPGLTPALRAQWLRTQYPHATVFVFDQTILDARCRELGLPSRPVPHNDAAADVQRHFMGWVCTAVLARTVDAVFTSEDYGAGFAAVLGQYVGQAVRHVSVDAQRLAVPVSGSAVRRDVHAARSMLPPHVYAHFVGSIAVLGGESSGKTTLAQALAERLETRWVSEYGRERWHEQGGALNFDDMLLIAATQLQREAQLRPLARRWLVCDSTPLTSLFYSLDGFGRADDALVALAALADRRYDHVLLCAPDFPFVQDGTRRDVAFRQRQHDWTVRELHDRGISYTLLSGSLGARVKLALSALSGSAPGNNEAMKASPAEFTNLL